MANEISPSLFSDLETEARACMRRLELGEPSLERRLATLLDFMLWSLFDTDDVTSGYWSDGIELSEVECEESGVLVLDGLVWCADHHEQWPVPLQAALSFEPREGGRLEHVSIYLGDGSRWSLQDHPSGRRVRRPDTWLCQFEVDVPSTKPPSVDPLLAQLRAWLAENPTGQLVGPEWQPMSQSEAERLIRERAEAGELLVLTPTWLDGGPAARLA